MEPAGKKLYQLYVDFQLEQGIGIDPWEELTNGDQIVWENLELEIRSAGWSPEL